MSGRRDTTLDPAELFQTPEELRAIHEDQRAHEAPPADRAYALQQLDLIIAHLGETPDLLELERLEPDHHCAVDTQLAYGICDACAADARERGVDDVVRHARARRRFQFGRLALCRDHAVKRLKLREKYARMTVPRGPERPADLPAWVEAAATAGLTEREVTLWLEEWHVDEDRRVGLLERYSDIRATIETRLVLENAWLDAHPRVEPGCCDRCRKQTGEHPRRTIDGRDLCTRCALAQHTHDRKEAA